MIECSNCNTEVDESTSLCNVCLYPINGTEEQKSVFIAKQVMQKSDVEWSIKSLGNSRNILFGLAIFYLIVPNLLLLRAGFSLDIVLNVLIALLFAGCGFMVYKKPKLALGVPLLLAVAYYILLLSIDPMLFMNGSLWKLIVLIGLSIGLTNVYKSDKILKENPYLASVLGYNKVSDKN